MQRGVGVDELSHGRVHVGRRRRWARLAAHRRDERRRPRLRHEARLDRVCPRGFIETIFYSFISICFIYCTF